MTVNFEELLNYLSEWKCRSQICKDLGLTYVEMHHLVRFGVKGNFIKCMRVVCEDPKSFGVRKKGFIKIYKKM